MSIQNNLTRAGLLFAFYVLPLFVARGAGAQAPTLDEAAVVRGVDAAVRARFDGIASYTVTEHYAVLRGSDEKTPAAEMTVKTTYQRDTGKSYVVLSETGSDALRHLVLDTILDREKEINLPANREASWLTSANYVMKLKPGGPQEKDGRSCYELAISPRHKASNLIEGTIWVDAKDESIVDLEGTASKSASAFTGPAQVERKYASVSGFAQATEARATSNSFLFGKTVVTIDYRDYEIKVRSTP